METRVGEAGGHLGHLSSFPEVLALRTWWGRFLVDTAHSLLQCSSNVVDLLRFVAAFIWNISNFRTLSQQLCPMIAQAVVETEVTLPEHAG